MKLGVQIKVPVPSPLSAKAAPAGRFSAVKSGMVASGSVADKSKFNSVFSIVLREPIVANNGA